MALKYDISFEEMKSKAFDGNDWNLEDSPNFFESVRNFLGFDKPGEKLEHRQMIGLVESLISENCEIIAKNHQKVRVKAGDTAGVTFKIINSSVVDWPPDSTIENDCSDFNAQEKFFKFTMKQRSIAYLRMSISVPALCDD